jgi:hypothetical protein
MAYMNQDKKAAIAPVVKKICAKYGVKGSLSVRNHSTLCLTVKSGKIDFFESFNRLGTEELRPAHLPFTPETKSIDVNPYHYQKHFDGVALRFLKEVVTAMNEGNHDRSDIMTDYFDVGWYIDVNIGKWDKPYILEK